MKVEELLKMLADAGLEQAEIKDLLTKALASMPAEEPEVNEDEEKEKAGKLFGIDL